MSTDTKAYLGDSVYVEFDGFGFWLTTSDGVEVTNKIYLEPNVFDALVSFCERALDQGVSRG